MYAPTLEEAEKARVVFRKWARSEQFDKAAELLDEDWDRMVAYYAFPKEHWLHLRTTNVIESPFASVRLRTAASKRYKKVAGATVMIWKLLLVAEQAFRKLNAPDLLGGGIRRSTLCGRGVPAGCRGRPGADGTGSIGDID